ncbi:hypothetical protein VTK73DRAFT_5343 [Phialemonium thermophilum]|uniref:Methyltransferase type 11 domain-containing protein n=1 Tax=Phialemonium thermophilum TaxID=223376 RepID=A0ABR3Y7E8_9PEZI
MSPDQSTSSKVSGPAAPPLPRAESISSTSGATAMSSRTIPSSEHLSSIAETPSSELPKPFVVRNGRTYLSDPSIPYPLPVDLSEIHRQSLRMLLLFQLFGGPVCSPAFSTRPPRRVLEVGCGSAFWSMICHRYFARQGHKDISFTGIDIAPVAPGAPGYADAISGVSDADTIEDDGRRNTSSAAVDGCPDKDMKWQFVQHDLRKFPWPLPDNDFDLVIVKDMSLVTHMSLLQRFMDEYIRVLRPGGTLEIWESDHTIRMLRPHVPELPLRRTKPAAVPHVQGARTPNDHRFDSDSDGSEDSEQDADEAVSNLGAYVITRNTPLSSPLNNFLVEYNGWVSRALEARGLSPMPCTVIGPLLLQESETLTNIMSRRLAVPLSEIRWEREGVGGVVTKDGKSYIETKGRGPVGPGGASLGGGAGGVTGGVGRSGASSSVGGQDAEQSLTTTQAALRKTALTTVVQQIHSLEWILRDVSGKSQDEWDGWLGKMMNDLVKEQGTSWGECLEIGAWWATKRA